MLTFLKMNFCKNKVDSLNFQLLIKSTWKNGISSLKKIMFLRGPYVFIPLNILSFGPFKPWDKFHKKSLALFGFLFRGIQLEKIGKCSLIRIQTSLPLISWCATRMKKGGELRSQMREGSGRVCAGALVGMRVGQKRGRTSLGQPSDQQGKTHLTVGCTRANMLWQTSDTRPLPQLS